MGKKLSSVLRSAVLKAKIQIFSRYKLIYAALQQTGRTQLWTVVGLEERDRKFQRIMKNMLLDLIPIRSFLFYFKLSSWNISLWWNPVFQWWTRVLNITALLTGRLAQVLYTQSYKPAVTTAGSDNRRLNLALTVYYLVLFFCSGTSRIKELWSFKYVTIKLSLAPFWISSWSRALCA